jgi:hypothetical protein
MTSSRCIKQLQPVSNGFHISDRDFNHGQSVGEKTARKTNACCTSASDTKNGNKPVMQFFSAIILLSAKSALK